MRRTKDNTREVLTMDSDPEVWRHSFASASRSQLRDGPGDEHETAAEITLDNVTGPDLQADPSLVDGETNAEEGQSDSDRDGTTKPHLAAGSPPVPTRGRSGPGAAAHRPPVDISAARRPVRAGRAQPRAIFPPFPRWRRAARPTGSLFSLRQRVAQARGCACR